MSADVIDLLAETTLDEAWAAYAKEARKLADKPKLLSDRAFNEKLARLHKRWLRLFHMQDSQ